MAVFEIVEGLPGNGKSLYTARRVLGLLRRNKRWYQRSGVVRKIKSNLKFSPEFEELAGEFLSYWVSADEVSKMRDCDLVWDEIAAELDSRSFNTLSDDLKRFLSQYDKRGVEIYANTQDYSMIDLRARMFVTRVARVSKVIGSRRPSPTRPPIKNPWGLIVVRDAQDFRAEAATEKKFSVIPSEFFFIEKELTDLYDTRQDILPTSLPPKILRKQVEIFPGDEETKPIRRIKLI